MPILDLQQRMRELGRIRLGQKSTNGAPQKLDRFRFTSASEDLVKGVAAAYGGTPAPWSPPDGRAQWEVVTDSTRVPILLPPNPVSQWLETWSGGGCQRRCDGVAEQLSDQPCICDTEPGERACKPTTRLNVVLRDIPGMGVWRVETHGWYAALELPAVAEFAERTRGMLAAWLTLEERVVKANGQTRKFMVPGIDVDVTPAQLLAGSGGVGHAQIGGPAPREIEGAAAAALPADGDGRDWFAEIAATTDLDALRHLYEEARQANAPTEVGAAITSRAAEISGAPTPGKASPADPDAVWAQIVAAAPVDWTTAQLEEEFAAATDGTFPGSASAQELQAFLERLTVGEVSPWPEQTEAAPR